VYENVEFAMQITEALPKEIRRQVPMALALVGLSKKLKLIPTSYPAVNSKGSLWHGHW